MAQPIQKIIDALPAFTPTPGIATPDSLVQPATTITGRRNANVKAGRDSTFAIAVTIKTLKEKLDAAVAAGGASSASLTTMRDLVHQLTEQYNQLTDAYKKITDLSILEQTMDLTENERKLVKFIAADGTVTTYNEFIQKINALAIDNQLNAVANIGNAVTTTATAKSLKTKLGMTGGAKRRVTRLSSRKKATKKATKKVTKPRSLKKTSAKKKATKSRSLKPRSSKKKKATKSTVSKKTSSKRA